MVEKGPQVECYSTLLSLNKVDYHRYTYNYNTPTQQIYLKTQKNMIGDTLQNTHFLN